MSMRDWPWVLLALAMESSAAELDFVAPPPVEPDVVIAEYRGKPIAVVGPVGVDWVGTQRYHQGGGRSRAAWTAFQFQSQQWRLAGVLRSRILEHWTARLGIQIDPKQAEAEKRRVLAQFVGKETLSAGDLDSDLRAPNGATIECPWPSMVKLLRMNLKEPAAAERLYRDKYREKISERDWRACRRLYGTEAALKTYVAMLHAWRWNRVAEFQAKEIMQTEALRRALEAKNVIGDTKASFELWLQHELKYVKITRADMVALFLGLPPATEGRSHERSQDPLQKHSPVPP
jgi:hypothetical protein